MSHVFLEFANIDPGVKTLEDLHYVLRKDDDTAFSISPEVAQWFKQTLQAFKGQKLTLLKNCRIAFADGAEFVEIDNKGNVQPVATVAPAWYPDRGEFLREKWLINKEMHDQNIVEFLRNFLEMYPNVKDRRVHGNLLFDLQLDKIDTEKSAEHTKPPAGKIGNKNRLSTQPKVNDLKSFDMFSQFYSNLAKAVIANQFPTMQVLTGQDNLTKASTPLKGAVRTWFKAITGELPPNNKKVEAGHAEVFCAPIQTSLQQITDYGLEKYYAELSQAIQQAGDLTLDKFEYPFPKQ
ncbi:hypothetical protein [Pectobacterium polaris]|uniref:hypothetical protein n=1 Tax=Pectobacterium polaris TaxID=2042057 RepID=UPI00203173C3|nr:hypothetical protein [Pectobacterium polaris]MCL6360284.1 hypothetical protein [Pectobacterium polaris]